MRISLSGQMGAQHGICRGILPKAKILSGQAPNGDTI
jgi:hypothetical protein